MGAKERRMRMFKKLNKAIEAALKDVEAASIYIGDMPNLISALSKLYRTLYYPLIFGGIAILVAIILSFGIGD